MKIAVVLLAIVALVGAKIYSRDELKEALQRNGVPGWQISTWQCIAKHESNFDTTAHNTQTGDHGIFQISEIYWCSPPGKGCGVTCSSLRSNPDITDDIKCAQKVYKETEKMGRNGFTAWTVYNKYCK